MKKNKKRNFIVLGIVIVLVACITIMLFQVKGEKKEVVETDQNSYRYIKVDGKDYRYRTNLKTILFLGIDTTDETKNQGQSDAIDLAIFDRDQQKIKIISLSRLPGIMFTIIDVTGLSTAFFNASTTKIEGSTNLFTRFLKLLKRRLINSMIFFMLLLF